MTKDHFLLLFLFLVLHQSLSIATENNQCTSSCGEVTNISFPFRLKGDPKICGDSKYELSCLNNRTVLSLYSGEYYVRHIDHTNYTIRVADVGMRKGNCSSLPRRSLSCGNFSYQDLYSACDYKSSMFYGRELSKTISIVNCTQAVDSQLYIDFSSCIDEVKLSNFSRARRRIYAMVDANVSNVETACTIELMAMIPWWVDGNNLRSYAQIHVQMVYGFELSWIPIVGKVHCKGHYDWDINSKRQIQCGKNF
ncbi:LEAF RUST 10 DISEASE-RESISTANCE LOCUS RECEPTOR-LIKE PROTEIN KINASE-like 2.7 [Rhodamnia argentea]|uniref:LEAF RUST 10 DISEASE-RESISTANCE LOCUS RECEPTOR-LIKE PROTEIN KINASE-like 2.7 n=1 Tax=Rhodamnia argentea TaxID=178133 RepID=A0ABM3HMH9_9MYRT|nr:LEAF RUST 10 DISEASE-RESISTANCE LOCUS RECEPTOR-LIKE PROTEIN KINASE-like 2.7 [Rhodamnia argentea]